MKKSRKLIALVLMGIMLFGGTLNTQAFSEHEHLNVIPYGDKICYDSFSGGTHPYYIRDEYTPNGDIISIYGSCETVIYRYKQLYSCGTCSVLFYHFSSDCVHTSCPQ